MRRSWRSSASRSAPASRRDRRAPDLRSGTEARALFKDANPAARGVFSIGGGSEMTQAKARYSRILVKLSGEALMGNGDYGIDPAVIRRIAGELQDIRQMEVQVAVVIGGGNIFRGAGLARAGMDRVAADHMGMLATVMNALAMQDALESLGLHARVMSAIRINEVCEDYIRRRAMRHLEKGRVTIFAAGTGDRKSTRLNSSHLVISYAVFCLKKKKTTRRVAILYLPTISATAWVAVSAFISYIRQANDIDRPGTAQMSYRAVCLTHVRGTLA